MKETKRLICIGCPMGCPLAVAVEDGVVLSVTGNTCKRGDAYARREVTAPTRILTSTLPVSGGDRPTVPVKTAGEVPTAQLIDCAKALRGLTVPAPVAAGQILCRDLCGTGVDLIATRSVAAR